MMPPGADGAGGASWPRKSHARSSARWARSTSSGCAARTGSRTSSSTSSSGCRPPSWPAWWPRWTACGRRSIAITFRATRRAAAWATTRWSSRRRPFSPSIARPPSSGSCRRW